MPLGFNGRRQMISEPSWTITS